MLFSAAGPRLSSAQETGCLSTVKGVICSPPNGGIITDLKGNIVCGPGYCTRDRSGQGRCSSVSGGAVTVDSTGTVLCVEGCVPASSESCRVPTR